MLKHKASSRSAASVFRLPAKGGVIVAAAAALSFDAFRIHGDARCRRVLQAINHLPERWVLSKTRRAASEASPLEVKWLYVPREGSSPANYTTGGVVLTVPVAQKHNGSAQKHNGNARPPRREKGR